MESQEIQETASAEARKRRLRNWALTPQERLDKYFQLQALANQVLQSNPVALAEFHRRNRRIRSQSQVQALEACMLKTLFASSNHE